MKAKFFIPLVAFLIMLHFASHAQTQTEMNLEAGNNFKKADKELNVIYQKILKSYASQPAFIKKFKIAQRLWVQLRDAELEAKFPGPDYYGTVEPMCRVGYLESLTRQRIKLLQVWLDGPIEAEVCNGSVNVSKGR